MTNEYIPSYEVAKNWYAHESETLELEFDRFVRKVQADAWDEGRDSAHWVSFEGRFDDNPYRN